MISDGMNNPVFLGMGFAGAEVITKDEPNQEPSLILPENTYKPQPEPERREFGFNAIKAWKQPPNDQRQHFGIRTQSD